MHKELQQFYDKAFDWILRVGPRIILAIVVFFIGQWLIGVLRRRLTAILNRREMHYRLQPFIEGVVAVGLHIALVLLIMELLGIELTIFAAGIAAAGAAIGLALSGVMQNFASGIIILAFKPFVTGDNIVAQGSEGTVTSIQIFYTIVTTFDSRTVIIPNSKLSNEVIINITRQGRRRLDIELKFSYGQDVDHIRQLMLAALKVSANTVQELMPPRIGVTALEADGYKLRANVWVNAHGFEDTRMVIHEDVITALKAGGVKLPGM